MSTVADVFATALGLAIFGALVAWAVKCLWDQARAADLLRPVATGLGLRLIVMLVAHFVSVWSGDGGFFFLDDSGYMGRANRITDAWLDGRVIDPAGYEYAGSYIVGYDVVVAWVFLLVGTSSVLAAKLVNVLLGAATVLLAGLIGERLGGKAAGRRAAWVVALAPTLVWWSAPMLKEVLAGFLVTSVVLAALIWTRRAQVLLSVALVALAATRPPVALAVIAGLLMALVVSVLRRRRTVDGRRLLEGLGIAAGCVVAGVLVMSRGDPAALTTQFSTTFGTLIETYRGSGSFPANYPYDLVRNLLGPYPWAFDAGTDNWYRALYPGMWVWYAALPAAVAGAWRLRWRPEIQLLIVATLVMIGLNAFASGLTFRQRSSVEALVLIAAAVTTTSWRPALRYAAFGYAAIAVFAGVQSRSLAVGMALLGVAATLELVARRAPQAPAVMGCHPEPGFERFGMLRAEPVRTLPARIVAVVGNTASRVGAASGNSPRPSAPLREPLTPARALVHACPRIAPLAPPSTGRVVLPSVAALVGGFRVAAPAVASPKPTRAFAGLRDAAVALLGLLGAAVVRWRSVMTAGRVQVGALRGAAPEPLFPAVVGPFTEWVRVAAVAWSAPQPAVPSGRGLRDPRPVAVAVPRLARAIPLWSSRAVAATRVQVGALRAVAPQPALASEGTLGHLRGLTVALRGAAWTMLFWAQRAVAGTQEHVGLIRRRTQAPRAPALAVTLPTPLRDLYGDAPQPAPPEPLPSTAALLGTWASLRRPWSVRLDWLRRLLSVVVIEVGLLRLEAPPPRRPAIETMSPAYRRLLAAFELSAAHWVVPLSAPTVLPRASAPPLVAAAPSPVAIRTLRLLAALPEAAPSLRACGWWMAR